MTEFKINQAIRAGSTTYLPGMEDKLAKLLTDEQFERLKKAGHIGKPDAPRTQTFRPPVSGKLNTSEQDATDTQAKAEAKAAELKAQEAAAIKAAMDEDDARRKASAESEFKSQLESKLSDLASAIERKGIVKVQVNETTEQSNAIAQAEADPKAKTEADAKAEADAEAAAKKKADAAARAAAHRAKLKADKEAAAARAKAEAARPTGELAAQLAGEHDGAE